jgi:hypothetical protein
MFLGVMGRVLGGRFGSRMPKGRFDVGEARLILLRSKIKFCMVIEVEVPASGWCLTILLLIKPLIDGI